MENFGVSEINKNIFKTKENKQNKNKNTFGDGRSSASPPPVLGCRPRWCTSWWEVEKLLWGLSGPALQLTAVEMVLAMGSQLHSESLLPEALPTASHGAGPTSAQAALFVAFDTCYIFCKVKAGPSTRKQINTHFTAMPPLLRWSEPEPAGSPW